MDISESSNNETFEIISGILFGFIGIPVFSLFLPLWLAKKWKLNYSFWPKTKNWITVSIILLLYVILANYEPIKVVLEKGISISDFSIHFISALLFHVTYYPLFAVFIFPVFRKNFGLMLGIIFTSLGFSLYHLTQFHFFPAGITLEMQLLLFIAFSANLLFYLLSESVILVALTHSISGAVGLIANGTVFNQIDFLFYLTIIIIGSLFVYMIRFEIKEGKTKEFDSEWWLQISIRK